MCTLEQIGLAFQIVGVLIVFGSQVRFYLKARKKGGLFVVFFKMLTTVRIGGLDDHPSKKDVETVRKTHPEASDLADYLSEDIRDSAFGLLVTLIGLFIELGMTFV